MTSAVTSSPATARVRMLAGERQRDGTNGGHLRNAGDTANLTEARTAADGDRTTTVTRMSGDDDRVDDDSDIPAVLGVVGGVDKVSGHSANTAVAFPSDEDDRSGGGAWLDELRRRRRTG
uniref:Uncharacterized protein n=1 Tax=Oryza sativa subsp. japonica TaxID=39947 RepID=Q6ZL71_ORYSJ|nr:hypothetical protein [Oryza sativa Japonica Group]